MLLFYQPISGTKKKQLISIVRSFHSLWGKYAREKRDIKMLNEMNDIMGLAGQYQLMSNHCPASEVPSQRALLQKCPLNVTEAV